MSDRSADLDLIREASETPDATDQATADLAVATLARHLREGYVPMSATALHAELRAYGEAVAVEAAEVLSQICGQRVVAAWTKDGRLTFEPTAMPLETD